MGDANESKNDSTFLTGLSRKRSYQGIRDSISGSLKKIGNKKLKLDGKLSSDSTFKYGNYNRYYGYRNENKEEDLRLTVLKKEWFENKSVLDIGSNVGHVSLWIGRNCHPEKIKGVDIDCELVKSARKNIVHYIDENYVSTLEQSFSNDNDDEVVDGKIASETSESEKASADDSENVTATEAESKSEENVQSKEELPVGADEDSKSASGLASIDEKPEINDLIPSEKSEVAEVCSETEKTEDTECVENNEKTTIVEKNEDSENICEEKNEEEKEDLSRKEAGQVLMERLDQNKKAKKENVFPYNVTFILENYVPAGKQILQYIKEEYDVILCLSVTKWVQLNFGDFGLKLMFKKIFKQLHPGGKLILEPQPYKSYKRRKNLTPEIRRNYDSMKLMPDQYIEYLLSNEVGFAKSEQIDITPHQKQGFQRPIYLLTKE